MVSALTPEFISRYDGRVPPWGFDGLGYVIFKRTYARTTETGNSERWQETVRRVVDGAQAVGAGYTDDEAQTLFDHMFNLRGTFAGRGLWQLGTPNVERFGGDSLVNCWWTELRRPTDLEFLFNELMLGGGVGFSVQQTLIGELPRVRWVRDGVRHEPTHDADFIVPDKREGWGTLLRMLLDAYFTTGKGFTYSTVLLRPHGTPIKTFGGVASGPGPLVDALDKIQDVLIARSGLKLRSVDVLDIANLVGWMVVAGNVRRSAQIAVGDPDDLSFLRAKRWDRGKFPPHRSMSNNSVAAQSLDDMPAEFWDGYEGKGEPYGLVNLENARRFGRMGEERRDDSISGVNPCGEIPLAHHESCNLAEIFLPRVKSFEQLVELSSLLYKGQKAIAALPYIHPTSQTITHQNMRLGLSVTGLAQATTQQLGWLNSGYVRLRELDKVWSKLRGWPESIRLTTVKPSGTVSLLAGVTSGVHPGFAEHYIRRVRMASDDPLVELHRQRGFQVEPDVKSGELDHRTAVVSFPCSLPKHTLLAGNTTAVAQLEFAQSLQNDWADNAVSVSVYYRKEELQEIREYLSKHWSAMKTVSFMLHKDHGFELPPFEEITSGEYARLQAQVQPFRDEDDVARADVLDDLCETGHCPVR